MTPEVDTPCALDEVAKTTTGTQSNTTIKHARNAKVGMVTPKKRTGRCIANGQYVNGRHAVAILAYCSLDCY